MPLPCPPRSVGQSAPLADPDRLWPLGRLYFLLDPATLDPISATNRKIRQLVSQAMDYIHRKVWPRVIAG